MTRRAFSKGAVAAGAATVLSKSSTARGDDTAVGAPNILFIMTDQQHALMMSCAGNRWLKTPAMDSLAREGVRFEHAYCANPVCAPSRISMATGVMPCRFGADANGSARNANHLPAAINENSMGKIMKRAGYETFYGGKVHMSKPLAPQEAGYDEFFKDQREQLPDACLRFMKRPREKPFFAVASFINPHDICFAHRARNGINTQGVLKLYEQASSLPEDQLPPLPPNYGIPENEPPDIEANLDPRAVTPAVTMRREYDDRAWRINRWIYHRLTENVDQLIGKILKGLKDAGLDENTVVIFTSDHGNMDASHHLASKSLPYEESAGVPLIIKQSGQTAAGETDRNHLVSTGLDILPTLCDYAGVGKPAHLLGSSLRPIAEGKAVRDWPSFVACENDWFRMIRSSRCKYCAFVAPGSGETLFDMEKDPGELRNLAGNPEYAEVLDEHRKMLAEWARRSNDDDIAKFLKGSE